MSEPVSSVPATPQSAALQAIAEGKFDAIFEANSDRLSQLYRSAQSLPRKLLIELTKSGPVRPVIYVDAVYPPIAKVAHVEGTVEFHLVIGTSGLAEGIAIESGPQMLWQAVSDAITKWRFPPGDVGKTVRGSILFGLNCLAEGK